MRKVISLSVFFLALGVVFAGTSYGGDAEEQAKELWGRIQGDKYQETWALFPGKGKLYEGTEPHGMLLTTYVNETSDKALKAGAKELPKGSILIKENYMPDKTLAAITVMEKTGDGQDDWFWV